MSPPRYNTQLQAGLGLPQETRSLLELWHPGMDRAGLFQAALQSGRFPNVSARRLRNIVVECFAPRYLVAEPQPARFLKHLTGVLSSIELTQLYFLYTCRANLVLADFVQEIYWERYAAGATMVTHAEVQVFVQRAVDDGKTVRRWTASTVERVSTYLSGCCADYGLLGKRSLKGREILSFRIESRVAAYLAHDLHFTGLGDNSLTAHTDWQLFGLSRDDVRDELKRLSLKGYLILQSAGDVTHIGWKNKSMDGFIDVIAQG